MPILEKMSIIFMTTAKNTNASAAQTLKTNTGFNILKAGDLVEGVLMEKESKTAYFDLGAFGSGVVFGVQFVNAGTIIKSLVKGDKISAKVLDPENKDGYVEMSLTDAGTQKNWEVVKELKDKGDIFTVKITGANSGGLLTEVNGVKAFLPVSQLTVDHYPRINDGDRAKILDHLKKFIGTDMAVKVMDIKIKAQKLIVSERETVQANTTEILNQYKVGDVIDGMISGVADFGAFVKFVANPQIEGLIHISELDHLLIDNTKEIVKIGDSVKAKIVDIKAGRVSLSLKALKPDPWLRAEELFKAGDEVSGKIIKFNPFGAFVALPGDLQGLIHVSEFGSQEEMRKQLEAQKSYQFKVEMIKAAEKRIILKLKK